MEVKVWPETVTVLPGMVTVTTLISGTAMVTVRSDGVTTDVGTATVFREVLLPV